MALSLDSISSDAQLAPPRIVLHGPHGVGKTTFGACAPSPILLMTEDGRGKLNVPHFPLLTCYAEVTEALTVLRNEDHGFGTVVIDSLDWLEPHVWEETRMREGWDDIESPGFGKGYVAADVTWREFLTRLKELREARSMAVILLAHSEVKRFDAPDTEPYDRYQIKLHKRAAALVEEWADAVLFANHKVFTTSTEVGFNKSVSRGVGSGQRALHTEERPAHKAKNRYSLPPELPFALPDPWAAFEAALTAPAAPATPTNLPNTSQEAA